MSEVERHTAWKAVVSLDRQLITAGYGVKEPVIRWLLHFYEPSLRDYAQYLSGNSSKNAALAAWAEWETVVALLFARDSAELEKAQVHVGEEFGRMGVFSREEIPIMNASMPFIQQVQEEFRRMDHWTPLEDQNQGVQG